MAKMKRPLVTGFDFNLAIKKASVLKDSYVLLWFPLNSSFFFQWIFIFVYQLLFLFFKYISFVLFLFFICFFYLIILFNCFVYLFILFLLFLLNIFFLSSFLSEFFSLFNSFFNTHRVYSFLFFQSNPLLFIFF